MAVKLTDFGLDSLSVDDRLALAQQLWDSLTHEAQAAPLTHCQSEELERRLVRHESSPEDVVSWEIVRDRALKRIGG